MLDTVLLTQRGIPSVESTSSVIAACERDFASWPIETLQTEQVYLTIVQLRIRLSREDCFLRSYVWLNLAQAFFSLQPPKTATPSVHFWKWQLY